MSREYQQDLRLLVGVDEVKGGLEAATERDPILSNRGIGYLDANGSTQGLAGATGETNVPSQASDGEGLNDQQEIDQITDEEDGIIDADDLLDGEMELGDTLKELVAEDCDTGEEIRIRTDGDYVPPDALFAADDGAQYTTAWEDADTPPILFGYISASEWRETASGQGDGYTARTAIEAVENAIAAQEAGAPSLSNGRIVGIPSLTSTNFAVQGSFDLNGGPAQALQTYIGNSRSCILGSSASCPTLSPRYEFWPEDPANEDRYIITYDASTGTLSTNSFDGQAPNNFDTKGLVDFCTAGGQFGRFEPLADGGFAVSERVSDGGALQTNSTYKVFNKAGVLTSFVGDENIMTGLRPKDPG